MKMLYVISRP